MCKQSDLLAIKTKAGKNQLDCFPTELERKPHKTLETVTDDLQWLARKKGHLVFCKLHFNLS